MKKIKVLCIILVLVNTISAQLTDTSLDNYRRSSIYVSFLETGNNISQEEADIIFNIANDFKISDKYNEHAVGKNITNILSASSYGIDYSKAYVKGSTEFPKKYKKYDKSKPIVSYGPFALNGPASEVIEHAINGKYYDVLGTAAKINNTLKVNKIPQLMIYKWFNGKDEPFNGSYYDVELIKERGAYNSTELDILQANESIRGLSIIQDAGFELIPNTYFLGLDVLIESNRDREIREHNDNIGFYKHTDEYIKGLVEHLAGYTVTIVGYLFKLNWDEETENIFFSEYYNEHPDKLFESEDFKLEFVGNSIIEKRFGFYILNDKGTPLGIDNVDPVFRKQKSQEALDIAINQGVEKIMAALQNKYEDFRVKAPIIEITPNGVSSFIGYKEGLNKDSKFEVLQKKYNEKMNRFEYEKIGNLKTDAKNIWDNRYTIEGGPKNIYDEIKNVNNNLDRTLLKGGSKKMAPGMLIRQTK